MPREHSKVVAVVSSRLAATDGIVYRLSSLVPVPASLSSRLVRSRPRPFAFAPALAVANVSDSAFLSPLCNPCGIPSAFGLTRTRLRTPSHACPLTPPPSPLSSRSSTSQ
ncbi:hypothetical protein EDB85DRAFT_2157833 [Lactarius pseudohatsudake]|nr:hypothetical protein EDB85DRAFT_2157833 [Lactarius pseudohatsudake]